MSVFLNLRASQFLDKKDLENSLDVPVFGKSVGSVFAISDIDDQKKSCKVHAAVCFAVGARHLLTSAHQLKSISNLSYCCVSMESVVCQECEKVCAQCCKYTPFSQPSYKRVANVYYAPNDADLAILEVNDDLGVSVLQFGKFSKSVSVMGISTAAPTLGDSHPLYRLRHTFTYSVLRQNKDMLEAHFLVPTTVSTDMVSMDAVPSSVVYPLQKSTSINVKGDSGSPIFQDGKVVALSKGWVLYELTKLSVRTFVNEFLLLEPYIPWVNTVMASGNAAEESKND